MRRHLSWLGSFPLAVDLADTVVAGGSGEVDLLTSEDELEMWIRAERRRFPLAVAARGRLDEVRALRDTVRDLLFAQAEGRSLPRSALRAINDHSARCPSYPTLWRSGEASWSELNADPLDLFRAAVARSAIDVIGGADRERLAVCRAPSCGMLFMRRDPRQGWCSPACGNRARVARHAARTRRGATGAGPGRHPR